jgi:serine/threonine protein kinase
VFGYQEDDYSSKIDMWSVGCVIAELYSMKPLFRCEDVKDQIHKMISLFGLPSESHLKNINNKNVVKFLRDASSKLAFSLDIEK